MVLPQGAPLFVADIQNNSANFQCRQVKGGAQKSLLPTENTVHDRE